MPDNSPPCRKRVTAECDTRDERMSSRANILRHVFTNSPDRHAMRTHITYIEPILQSECKMVPTAERQLKNNLDGDPCSSNHYTPVVTNLPFICWVFLAHPLLVTHFAVNETTLPSTSLSCKQDAVRLYCVLAYTLMVSFVMCM